MPATVILGAQWGDEGKGKLVDRLAEQASWVARFQGGNNSHIWAIHWVSDSAFLDSGELIPLLLVDQRLKYRINNGLGLHLLDSTLIVSLSVGY
mgnify:CR=1 FL=1